MYHFCPPARDPTEVCTENLHKDGNCKLNLEPPKENKPTAIIKQECYIYNFYFDNFSYKCFTIKQRKYYNYDKIYLTFTIQSIKCKYNIVD